MVSVVNRAAAARRTRLLMLGGAVVGVLLSACDSGEGNGYGSAVQNAAQNVSLSPSTSTPLVLSVTASPLNHGARLLGITNLPDGTELMLRISRASVSASAKVAVSKGGFAQDLYPNGGNAIPPGDYEVSVGTPLGDLQPEAVKAQLGSQYEALTGPFVTKGEFGRVIEYQAKVRIGGSPNPAADQAARKKAYQDHVAFSERNCRALPDTLERLTGVRLSAASRAQKIKHCLEEMAVSRKELVAESLAEP